MLLALGVGGCRSAPYAPTREGTLAPPGESEPAPNLDGNPLDAPTVVERICTPQGEPVTTDDETRRCAQDAQCRIVCVSDPLQTERE